MSAGENELPRSATLETFGQPPGSAELTALGRPAAWRVRGAMVRLAVTLVLAPLVAIIPPHAPWVVAVLAIGLILTRRRWTERLTVSSFSGQCPRCGEGLTLAPGTRLLNPHVLDCEHCHHSVSLRHTPLATEAA